MATQPVQLDFSKAVPIAPAQTPSPAPSSGVTLDFSQAQPIAQVTQPTNQQAQQPAPTDVNSSIGDFLGGSGILKGATQGAAQTVAGIDTMASKIPGVGRFLTTPLAGNQTSQQAIQDEANFANAPQSGSEKVGQATEGLAEFLMGDEALKGLSLADKLTKVAPVLKAAEKYPVIAKALQLAARQGTVAGAETLAKTGGNVPDAALAAGGTGIASGAFAAVPGAIKAVKGVVDLNGAQPALQSGIRDVLNTVSEKAGVKAPDANVSIRDAAGQVGDAILAKGKSIYQKLDQISGNRWQTYSDNIRAVNRALANDTGIDDDATNKLIQRKSDLEASQAQILEEAKEKGMSNADLAQANRLWRQGSAMDELNSHIQMSTEGLRPEHLTPAEAQIQANQEIVSPSKLLTRLQKMKNSGRLADAVGAENEKPIIRHANTAQNAVQKTKAIRNAAKTASRTVGKAALYGSIYEGARHSLGGE